MEAGSYTMVQLRFTIFLDRLSWSTKEMLRLSNLLDGYTAEARVSEAFPATPNPIEWVYVSSDQSSRIVFSSQKVDYITQSEYTDIEGGVACHASTFQDIVSKVVNTGSMKITRLAFSPTLRYDGTAPFYQSALHKLICEGAHTFEGSAMSNFEGNILFKKEEEIGQGHVWMNYLTKFFTAIKRATPAEGERLYPMVTFDINTLPSPHRSFTHEELASFLSQAPCFLRHIAHHFL